MYKVILVDDEPLILLGLVNLINWNEMGLEVIGQCSDGAEALELLSRTSAHILITDIRMPVLTGLELIETMNEKQMNVKYIVLSGYDDFEYVKKAIALGIENYLLKPVSVIELESTLQNIIQKIESEIYKQIDFRQGMNILKDNILYRWVAGDIEKGEFLERASLLHMSIDSSSFITVIIKVAGQNEHHAASKIPQKNLLRFAIQNICTDIIGSILQFQIFCGPEEDVTLIISNAKKQDFDAIKAILKESVSVINRLLGVDVFITVGSLETMFQNVHLSYTRAKQLQDYQMLRPSNSILFYDETMQAAAIMKKRFTFDGTELQDAIMALDRERTIRFVESFFSQLQDSTIYEPSDVKELVIDIVYQIKYAIRKKQHDSFPIFDSFPKLLTALYVNQSVYQIREDIIGLIHQAFDLFEHALKNVSPITTKLIRYIDEHLSENINLSTLAEKFNVSPGYLGYLFKKETGESFTNYVNGLRIEWAKKLLIETNLRITEISEQVGYTNANYFFTTFKKTENISPAEFRRSVP
ncbi:response regulator transcription factor [Paenibacillus glycanilyticus]|uniref:DNA-binding response regulator n=1 Tax=Paenibacillus glycanilyticus TaxID=126569 RepID=A0ABQ6GGG9_9BACL|nr:response regulator transcription factor [Paenibacillus glycanilyticus]GLX68433.1 DNA-binding response regulator [Paenibacillus glycanilyticus]